VIARKFGILQTRDRLGGKRCFHDSIITNPHARRRAASTRMKLSEQSPRFNSRHLLFLFYSGRCMYRLALLLIDFLLFSRFFPTHFAFFFYISTASQVGLRGIRGADHHFSPFTGQEDYMNESPLSLSGGHNFLFSTNRLWDIHRMVGNLVLYGRGRMRELGQP